MTNPREKKNYKYPDRPCVWTFDLDKDFYDTSCKEVFMFDDGNITDNDFKFCPYCGRPIKEIKIEEQSKNTDR